MFTTQHDRPFRLILYWNQYRPFRLILYWKRVQIAKRTILSDDALGVLVPILQDVAGWNSMQVRSFFNSGGFPLQNWDRVRTDWLTIRTASPAVAPEFDGGLQ